MRNLKDILEGIFDVDDNIDNIDARVIAQKWWNDQQQHDPYLCKATIMNNGNIVLSGHATFYTTTIPKHIKLISDQTISFVRSTIESLESINAKSIKLSQTIINDFNHNNQYTHITISHCDYPDYNWLPDSMQYIRFDRILHTTQLNLLNKYIDEISIQLCDYVNISNINCDHLILNNMKKLKNIHNISSDELSISDCKRLSIIDGNKIIRHIYIDGTHNKLNPDQLPHNISIIRAVKQNEDWLKENIIKLFPNIDVDSSRFPDPNRFKTKKGGYGPGSWVVAKSKANTNSMKWGSSRGSLMIDKIVKITPSGSIRCEVAGVRPYTDVELMREANKNKKWNYKDPNGLNDITGVGIEVGDEVVVHCKSGKYGTNNGIEVDTIVALTKSMVRCENNGLRPCHDICILRSQKECEKQFKGL